MYELKDSPLIPSDDEQADMYLCMVDELRRYGYEQYEISNFSIPGYESRHNLKYWQLDDYMGFGPGAHSCIGRTRYSYVRDLDRYIAGVLHGEDMIDEYETVGDFERAAEHLRQHAGRELIVGDDAVLQRVHGDYIAGRAPEHAPRGRADLQHLAGILVHCHDRRLAQDDAPALFVAEHVRRAEVDADVFDRC